MGDPCQDLCINRLKANHQSARFFPFFASNLPIAHALSALLTTTYFKNAKNFNVFSGAD
jgi:hypothetical protein